MKATFYGQFGAGENEVAIKPVLDQLRSFGVKSILDYSAEEDMPDNKYDLVYYMNCSILFYLLGQKVTRLQLLLERMRLVFIDLLDGTFDF